MKKIILRLAMLVLFSAGWASAANAAVAQAPLLVGGASVPPNLVFTFDDSGSMIFECLPEALCVGDYYVGTMPGGFGTFKNGVATFDSSLLFARQMRSAAKNSQYYNPAITYSPWLKSDGTRYPTYAATASPVDPRVPATVVNLVSTQTFTTLFCKGPDNCGSNTAATNGNNSSQSVYLAQYFNLTSGTGSAVGNFTQVIINGTAATTFPKGADRTDCGLVAVTVCTLAQEQQNFANWFTYYRSKLLAAIGGTANAFSTLPVSYRLGYGRINQTSSGNSIDGTNSGTLVRGLRSYTGADRDSFYTWLFGLQPDPGGTPLRRAMGDVGEYYSRSDNRGPWGAVPGTNDTTAHLTCRRAFHLLMTDGSWNGDPASNSAAQGNVDNTSITTPILGPNGQSYTYTRAYPYRDANSGTLADVAFYYWSKDLRTDLTNEVKPNASDPAFWQHMVNYTIGFGVNGNLVNPDDLAALTNNTKSWGNPASDANNKVDDLWHAAVNSRGISLSAADQQAYSDALRAVITNIDERTGSEAGVAVSGQFLSSTSKKYIPEYRTNVWVGELTAQSLDSEGNDGPIVWRASEHLPAAAARSIYTFKDTTTKGVTFTWASLTAQSMTSTLAVTAAEGPGLVNYLRGDPAGEGTTYRSRSKKLGDIVGSSPILVKDLVNLQYNFLPSTSSTTGTTATDARSSYRQFLRNKALRVPQVYVGSNDGFFHAFSDVNGTETFAFMPRAILGSVKVLSQSPYDHRYFVDGPPVETDIFDASFGASGGWRNMVLSTGGAGAKNIFAINIPVPSTPTGTGTVTTTLMPPGPADILWEVSNTGDFAELGYMIQAPESGLMLNGQWAAIVGNGYESASGRAQLFVINALTGALIRKLDTGIPTSGGGNGLSGVRVVKDIQQRIVAAYAGDLLGNLWKFDFSSSTPASWTVAFSSTPTSPRPLFNAVNRNGQAEPITSRPDILAHPRGGIMVVVGTGKLFEDADSSNTQERTLYGLWDKVAIGTDSSAATGIISGTATLVLQQVSATLSVSSGSPTQTQIYYTSTNNTVDFATRRGWRLPLTIQAGQRQIYDPVFLANLVSFKTVVPGASVQTCQASSGSAFSFLIDPFSGSAGTGGPLFDTNGDGLINSSDSPYVSIFQTSADGGDAIIYKGGSTGGNTGGNTGGGPDPDPDPQNTCTVNCGPPPPPQVCLVSPSNTTCIPIKGLGIKRAWRQIFNPPQ